MDNSVFSFLGVDFIFTAHFFLGSNYVKIWETMMVTTWYGIFIFLCFLCFYVCRRKLKNVCQKFVIQLAPSILKKLVLLFIIHYWILCEYFRFYWLFGPLSLLFSLMKTKQLLLYCLFVSLRLVFPLSSSRA